MGNPPLAFSTTATLHGQARLSLSEQHFLTMITSLWKTFNRPGNIMPAFGENASGGIPMVRELCHPIHPRIGQAVAWSVDQLIFLLFHAKTPGCKENSQ
jgi:hypothetical protein